MEGPRNSSSRKRKTREMSRGQVVLALPAPSVPLPLHLSTTATKMAGSREKQWRIHSGVVGVARPLGNHENNLEAPICDLLELGSSGSDSHANCSTKILNQDSAGRGRRSSARMESNESYILQNNAYMESNESYILQNNAENPAPTQLPLRFYKQKGVPRFIDKFKLSIQLQSSSFDDLPQSWTAPSTRG